MVSCYTPFMPRLIFGLVGLQGCGKGTLTDLLTEEYGAGYFRFSAIIGDILSRLALEKSRECFIKASIALRNAFGEDVFSYAIETAALQAKEDIVVIDGIRRPEDIVALEPLPHFHLIAIEADAPLRYERMKKRGEKATEAGMTWEQFLADENAPTERGIPFVMSRAKHRLQNNGSREAFSHASETLLASFGLSKRVH
jgi:dephospho-CoA kinase